jgi:hypothetical protein
MHIPAFSDLKLVGGTALALMLGHRESVDIDLFGVLDFTGDHLYELQDIGSVRVVYRSKHINTFFIDGIKVDFVNYRYPWLEDLPIIEGVKLASKRDIAAMKLNAVTGRGSKKDFIDLYYLLKEFSFEQMFQFYMDKFDDGNPYLVRKSLVYFQNADKQVMPLVFEDISWTEIKKGLVAQFREEGY